ncbi:PAS domain-containing sensor histidine kinase [Haloarchaeobius sp. DYHT-AS-18]|uniref:sensor histidine kinase n=1 Tax=Haloarchaeobius sp. DYHT-AS-18 TaxID=3446117 RepID=UPI003EC017E9
MTTFEDEVVTNGTLFDSIGVGLVGYDTARDEVVAVNEAFCQLAAVETDDVVGSDIATLVGDGTDNDAETVARFLRRTTESDASVTFETTLVTGDDTERPVVIDAKPMPGADETVLLTVHDDTRRDALEREYDEYSALMDEAMLVGELGWWEMEVDSGRVSFHPNKARMLGFEPDGFDHYTDFTYRLHPDDYEDAMEAMRALYREETDRYEIEYRIQTADGDYRWFHDVGRPTEWTGDGQPAVITGVAIDITARKETEQALREQREELALLNRLIHHDIRNDMAIVNLWLDLLRREFGEHLERVTTASDHTLRLTDSVRDVVEIITQKDGELELEPIHLSSALEPEIERVKKSFENTVIEQVGDDTDVMVCANPMLSSVFGNLLNNAVQHCDRPNPELTVRTAHRDGSVVVGIADNGPGIPDDLKERIFDRGTVSLDSEGTGLGLYIAKKLVTAYGGDIWVEDNEPEGSIVFVELQKAAT